MLSSSADARTRNSASRRCSSVVADSSIAIVHVPFYTSPTKNGHFALDESWDEAAVCSVVPPAFSPLPGLIARHWRAHGHDSHTLTLAPRYRWASVAPTHL